MASRGIDVAELNAVVGQQVVHYAALLDKVAYYAALQDEVAHYAALQDGSFERRCHHQRRIIDISGDLATPPAGPGSCSPASLRALHLLPAGFDVPNSKEAYIHRIGRCARAGAQGVAVTFFTGRSSRTENEAQLAACTCGNNCAPAHACPSSLDTQSLTRPPTLTQSPPTDLHQRRR